MLQTSQVLSRRLCVLPLSVIPEIRLTDKGSVLCPERKLVPLFETNL